jgi:hypothetical protein
MAPETTVRSGPMSGSAAFRSRWGAACLSAALAAGIAVEVRARNRHDRIDAMPRHERIRTLAESAMPRSQGDWIGRDVAPTSAAVNMLRPNVLLNLTFENLRTRETVNLCFVQCADARDLIGHFPPVCYRGNGMILEKAEERDWQIGPTRVPGMRYRFRSAEPDSGVETVVDNFMVLPVEGFARDMDAVTLAAEDTTRRHLGAAELQMVSDGSMTDERRDEIFRTLVAPTMPLLVCVGAEVQHD